MAREVTEHDEIMTFLDSIQAEQEKLSSRFVKFEENATELLRNYNWVLAELVRVMKGQRPANSIEEIAAALRKSSGQG